MGSTGSAGDGKQWKRPYMRRYGQCRCFDAIRTEVRSSKEAISALGLTDLFKIQKRLLTWVIVRHIII